MTKITEQRKKKFEQVVANRQSGLIIVLEDIHDPHNAAAILRTCDAFGIQKVYFIFNKEKSFNPKKIGKVSSSSANKWLDFEIFNSVADCLNKLKREGYTIFTTTLNEKSESFYDTDFTDDKLALVLGNEHRGVSEEVIQLSNKLIMLPMKGLVQSLNLSVTAAIFISEISRQRRFSNKKYKLNDLEQKSLIESFSRR